MGRPLGTCPLSLFVLFVSTRNGGCVACCSDPGGTAWRLVAPSLASRRGPLSRVTCWTLSAPEGEPRSGLRPGRAAAVSVTPRSLRSTPGVGGRDSHSLVHFPFALPSSLSLSLSLSLFLSSSLFLSLSLRSHFSIFISIRGVFLEFFRDLVIT